MLPTYLEIFPLCLIVPFCQHRFCTDSPFKETVRNFGLRIQYGFQFLQNFICRARILLRIFRQGILLFRKCLRNAGMQIGFQLAVIAPCSLFDFLPEQFKFFLRLPDLRCSSRILR